MKVPLDIVGDIAIFKFSRYSPWVFKKIYSLNFLRKNKSINVALEKTSGFSGNLRVQQTKWVAGEKRKDTLHKENDCLFYLNVDETYFSPRLSQERKIVSEEIFKTIKNNSKILILFSGIAPQAIVLAKKLKKEKIKAKIICSELNEKAGEFALKNIRANKVQDYIEILQGDSKKHCLNLAKKKQKFDFILMLRPNLQDTFLKETLKVAKKNTKIYYHGFGEKTQVKNEVLNEIKNSKRKIYDFEIRKAGDIGVNKYRFNVSFILKN